MQIPQGAKYGVWNHAIEQWTGEWFYSDADAAYGEIDCRHSGLPVNVIAVDETVDDSWLNELQE